MAFLSRAFKSSSVKNTVWSTAEATVYPLMMLAVTPFFLSTLGAETYGLWMLVNTIIASVGILNVGLGDTTIKFVSKYLALGKHDDLKGIIGATYSLYILLAIIVSGFCFFLAFAITYFQWFDIGVNQRDVVGMCVQIAGVTLGLRFIEQIFLGVFKGYERYDIASRISISGKIGALLVSIGLVALGFDLPLILAGSCIFIFVFVLIEGFLVYRFCGFQNFVPHFQKVYIKEVFSFGVWAGGLSILGIASTQVDKFIVVALTNMTVFAYYSIAIAIFTQIHFVFAAAGAWVFPFVNKLSFQNKRIDEIFFRAQFILLSVGAIALTVFDFLKDFIIFHWLGETGYANTIRFIDLVVVLNIAMIGTIMPFYFFNGSGAYKLNTLFTILTIVIRVVCMPVGYSLFSDEGLFYGLIVSVILVLSIQTPYFYKRVINVFDQSAWIKTVAPIVIFGVASFSESSLIILAALFSTLVLVRFIYAPRLTLADITNYKFFK